MAIQWEESLRLGVSNIDDQHKEIFTFFGKLSNAIQDGKGSDEVIELLNFLNNYSTNHFIDEEELMERYKYDGLEEQRQHHSLFKENIASITKLLGNTKPSNEIAFKVDATLIRYFISHIRVLDGKMIEFIKPLMT